MVMVISSIPDVPDELVALGLRRAHMCEILAGSASAEERETLFTIGLFSVADALLDMPMAEVLDTLPFTDEIQAALLRREGPKGELLAAVAAYERGEFPTPPPAARPLPGRRVPLRPRVGGRSQRASSRSGAPRALASARAARRVHPDAPFAASCRNSRPGLALRRPHRSHSSVRERRICVCAAASPRREPHRGSSPSGPRRRVETPGSASRRRALRTSRRTPSTQSRGVSRLTSVRA